MDNTPMQPNGSMVDEPMKRTYKGVMFATEQEKNQMIQLEAELQEYCQNLEGKAFEELWEKNESVKKLPPAIFGPFCNVIGQAMYMKENRDKTNYLNVIQNMGLDELSLARNEIINHRYTNETKQQLLGQIHGRELQCQRTELEAAILNIQTDDRNVLQRMMTDVCNRGYDPQLTEEYTAKINVRFDELDLAELTDLTQGCEEKSLEELENLNQILNAGNYNPKFSYSFMKKVRIPMEMKQREYVNSLIENLEAMTKEQILSVKGMIIQKAYPKRISALPIEKIDERLYLLDMQELMEEHNDFDNLSLSQIAELRNQIASKNVSKRSIATFEKKLKARETVIAFDSVSQIAGLAKQTVDQMGMGAMNIKIPIHTPDYLTYLNQYFQYIGCDNYADIPVVIIPDMGFFAVTRSAIYCNSPTGYTKISLSDFKTFLIDKKLLSSSLALTLVSGVNIPVSGSSGKKNLPQMANFLTFLFQNLNNATLLARFASYHCILGGLKTEELERRAIPVDVDSSYIVKLFLTGYQSIENVFGNHSNLRYAMMENWNAHENKVRAGYGIMNESQIVMYYDRSMFNSAKEGFALGCMFVHVKANNQLLKSIPYSEIHEFRSEQGKLVIVMISNETLTVDFNMQSEDMKLQTIAQMNEYLKGIQLLNAIGGTKLQAMFCPACGSPIRQEMKFCPKCGNRIG